jgi:hypothetical protein
MNIPKQRHSVEQAPERRGARRGTLATCAIAFAGLFASPVPIGAVVPNGEKVAAAAASANERAGRALPLWFEVTLRDLAGSALASGVLASHPTGLARLELVGHPEGGTSFVERHLLQGDGYRASRDGALVERPLPLLAPLFLLQTPSGEALRAALSSFDVAVDDVVLGRVGEHVAYVIGGRQPRGPDGSEDRQPSLWVDQDTFEVLRIDSANAGRVEFGTYMDFEGIQAPAWIQIEGSGHPPLRLEVDRVAPANAPAAAFAVEWLLAPPSP